MTIRVPATVVSLGAEEQAAALRVLESGRLVQGAEVEAFEAEFSQLVDGRECVAVNSGTSALHLGLLAAGIGPGDEVIVPSFSFAASANAVVMAGARPVFADIDPDSYCIDPASVTRVLSDRTAAVMAVHLYGHMADMGRLSRLAADHGLLLVEDAAQAHGASVDGTPAGAWGDVAAFSFYATKNMTTGEGGMVVCRQPGVARAVRLLRNQGMERQYHNEVAGLNNRMTEVAAAIGRVQLTRLGELNLRRRAVAHRYDRELAAVLTPAVGAGVEHVYHQYTVRVPERDRVVQDLQARGVEARVFYPVPIHALPAYATGDQLPETTRASAEVMSLPIHPLLESDEVDHVVASLAEAVSGL